MDKLKNNNLTTNDIIEPILSDLASKIEEKADRDEIPEMPEIEFPEKTDFALRCTYVKNNGASIQASFGLLLVKNT